MTFTVVKEDVVEAVNEKQKLTLEQFLSLPESDESFELVNGEVVKKAIPKFFHSSLRGAFLTELYSWADGVGQVMIEWSVLLKRDQKDWVPVPDLLYVSYDRLSKDWCEDAPCPVAPELVIEIVSPDQNFNLLSRKALDYLSAGVDRVWVVFPPMRCITVFFGDRPPETYRGARLITDELFPDLVVTVDRFFVKAGI
jgi:Uma2 family endonuclease